MKIPSLFGTLGGPLLRVPTAGMLFFKDGPARTISSTGKEQTAWLCCYEIYGSAIRQKILHRKWPNSVCEEFEDPGFEGVGYRHIGKQGLYTVVQVEKWNGHRPCCMRSNRRKALRQLSALSPAKLILQQIASWQATSIYFGLQWVLWYKRTLLGKISVPGGKSLADWNSYSSLGTRT